MRDETLTNVVGLGQKLVKNGPGYLSSFVLNKALGAALKVYDSASSHDLATLVGTLATAAPIGDLEYHGKLTKGLLLINGDAVQGTTVLTSNNTEVADGDTVTIGSTVYRFKNTPAQAYDVKRSGTVDTTLANFIKAINASGLGDGSDYFAGTLIHPTVFAGTTITAHHFPITAWDYGTVGNAIATTDTSATLSFTGATLASGAEGTTYDVTVGVA